MTSLQMTTKIDKTQPFHIYYDISMLNNDQTNGQPTPNLVYNEARNSPFINCPDNYFVSIIRFQLSTPSLPVMIPEVKIRQTDVNKLIYQLYIIQTATGNHFDSHVNYIPSNALMPVPAVPLTAQDLTTDYYFVYTVQQWITMLNTTLKTLSTAMGLDAAFFYFNVDTTLLKLYVPASWGTSYKLYCNKQLQTLLDSLPFKVVNTNTYPTVSYGELYEFQFYNDNYKNNETLNSINYWVMNQEASTTCLLNPISSVVFTTGLFPIQPSLLSPPKVYGADSGLFNNGNNSNLAPIITDFEIALSATNTYKEQIEYIPSSEYRLIDMYGSSPVSTLELSVYWKDKFNNLHNFKLNSGCSCNVKIMFRRKDFNAIALDL